VKYDEELIQDVILRTTPRAQTSTPRQRDKTQWQ